MSTTDDIIAIRALTDRYSDAANRLDTAAMADVYAVDGDRATARWNVTEFAKRREHATLDLFLGNYEDELVRTAEGWLFARRVLTRRAQARLDAQIRI